MIETIEAFSVVLLTHFREPEEDLNRISEDILNVRSVYVASTSHRWQRCVSGCSREQVIKRRMPSQLCVGEHTMYIPPRTKNKCYSYPELYYVILIGLFPTIESWHDILWTNDLGTVIRSTTVLCVLLWARIMLAISTVCTCVSYHLNSALSRFDRWSR